MELVKIRDELKEIGADVVAISSETRSDLAILKEKLEIPYPLLADMEVEMIKAFNVYHEREPKGRHIARPSIFVIDRNNTITASYVGENSRDRPSPEDILGWAKDAVSQEPALDGRQRSCDDV